jgi:hypothetical protein
MDAWKIVAALALLDAWAASVRAGANPDAARLSAQLDTVMLGMTHAERHAFLCAVEPAS